MEPIVLSLGGSVLIKDQDDARYIKELAKVLIEVSAYRKLYVVTGGGRIARFYINSGRELGADETSLDEMGIEVTRLNARLLMIALGDHATHISPKSYDEAVNAAKTHSIVVMGGVSPGITTDAVSALLAERAKAKWLVNATSVDGAYTADPKKDLTAKRLPKLAYKELISLVGGTPSGAGPNIVFDPMGAKVIERSRIALAIVDGRDLENLKNALEGKQFKGTLVQ